MAGKRKSKRRRASDVEEQEAEAEGPRRITRSIASRASSSATTVHIKQEEGARAVKRRRRAKVTAATSTAVTSFKAEEAEATATTMRVSRPATAAAAAAAATMVTAFDFLPTLAPAGIFVGCSGYHYRHWHISRVRPRNFYPFPSTAHEFKYYAAHFNSLEINFTFYRLPTADACARWAAQSPRPGFYTLKAHRYFTHTKRIHVDEWFKKKWEEAYWPRCQQLGSSLGCVLFQFPRGFKRTPITLQRLEDLGTYLTAQCPEGRFAVEFRHPSWFDEEGRHEAYPILQRHNLCLCGIHVANPNADAAADAEENNGATGSNWGDLRTGCHPPLGAYPYAGCDWGVYLRFHGDHSHGSYGAHALGAWADAVWRWRWEGLTAAASSPRRVFAFFNNDASMDGLGAPGLPSAVADAHRLGQLLARRLEEATAAGAAGGERPAAGAGATAAALVVKQEQP